VKLLLHCNHSEPVFGVRTERRKISFCLVQSGPRAAQFKPAEPQDSLQVREPHLDLLAPVPGLLEAVGACE
jgi:hypothetical protein